MLWSPTVLSIAHFPLAHCLSQSHVFSQSNPGELVLQQDATWQLATTWTCNYISHAEDFLRQIPRDIHRDRNYGQYLQQHTLPHPYLPWCCITIVQPQAPHPPDSTIVELCYGLLIQVLKRMWRSSDMGHSRQYSVPPLTLSSITPGFINWG